MTHEEAVTAMLAGGPAPAEAAAHLKTCRSCMKELETLRAVACEIERSSPPWHPSASFERRLIEAARAGGSGRFRWYALAASLALCACLLAALFTLRDAPFPAASHAELQGEGESFAWPEAWEEGTAGLLQAAEEEIGGLPEEPPEEIEEYLGSGPEGGWNA